MVLMNDVIRSVGARLCRVCLGDLEQPHRRTADINSVRRDICTKTQKSSLWLLAPLRTLFNWHYINVHIHSFVSVYFLKKYATAFNKV